MHSRINEDKARGRGIIAGVNTVVGFTPHPTSCQKHLLKSNFNTL